MKTSSMTVAAIAAAALIVPTLATLTLATPASAYYRWTAHAHYGPYGHGCKVVRTVSGGAHWHRWWVHRFCR